MTDLRHWYFRDEAEELMREHGREFTIADAMHAARRHGAANDDEAAEWCERLVTGVRSGLESVARKKNEAVYQRAREQASAALLADKVRPHREAVAREIQRTSAMGTGTARSAADRFLRDLKHAVDQKRGCGRG